MRQEFDCYFIGPVSLDNEQLSDGTVRKFVGGAIHYSPYAALAGGWRLGVLTKMRKEDFYLTSMFYIRDLTLLPSKATTSFHLTYHTADKERRTCEILSQCDRFTVEDLPKDISAGIYHLAGLIYGDYDHALFPYLAQRGKVACDLQGFLRHSVNGRLEYRDWTEKLEYLPYIHYLKADEAEAQLITGHADRKEAAQQLYNWGAKEIIITHNTEVLVYNGEDFYTCPIRARNLTGRTGRGDTTFGSYITERISSPIPEALFYATALVSLKMETCDSFKGSRKDVEEYQKEVYSDFLE